MNQSLDAMRENRAKSQPPVSSTGEFNRYLTQYKDQLTAALPKHLNADRMARLALTAFSQSTALQKCDPKSIFAAVVLSSQMGLEIGVSGQGYLVPYKGKATFVPGWQGIVDLVSRTGRGTVWTGAVFDGDHFDFALGDRPFIIHRPEGEDDPAKLTHVYAVGRVNGSEWPVIEVWPIRKVEKHFRKFNKVGDMHYAHANWEMYARKIPLLQVCKYMPKSPELTAAFTADYAAETGRGMTFDGEFVTLDPETEPPPAQKNPEAEKQALQTAPVEAVNETATGEITAAYVLNQVQQAPTADALELAIDLGRHLSAKERAEIGKAYQARLQAGFTD